MDEIPGNPADNRLAAGLSEQAVKEAVEASGYPLQTVVGAQLRARKFWLAEEWVFNDLDTNQSRALDLHATRPLYDQFGKEGQKRVRPELVLLVECKKTDMPYVFFTSDTRPGVGGAAIPVAGLHADSIVVRTDDDLSSWHFTTVQALGLGDHPFVAAPPSVALSLSKAARQGKDIRLSGEDPYKSLVLPLTKALGGYAARVQPPKTAWYHDLHIPIALAVIDGPMVQASVTADGVDYALTPWVRVYRHDVDPAADHFHDRTKLYAIDCVHVAWLTQYLEDHLEPFASEFATAALAHHQELASGRAFASGFGRDSDSGLPERLRPASIEQRVKRPQRIALGVTSQLSAAVGSRIPRRRRRHLTDKP